MAQSATEPKIVNIAAEMVTQLGRMVRARAADVVEREQRDALIDHQAKAYLGMVFEQEFVPLQGLPGSDRFLLPMTSVIKQSNTPALWKGTLAFDLALAERTRDSRRRAESRWTEMMMDFTIPAVYLAVPKRLDYSPYCEYVKEPMGLTFTCPITSRMPLLRDFGDGGLWVFFEDNSSPYKTRHYLWTFSMYADALRLMVRLAEQGAADEMTRGDWLPPEGAIELPYGLRTDEAFLRL